MRAVEIFVQIIDQIHIFLFNGEIKDISVASDTVRMNRFRDYGNSFLCCPAKTDLGRRMSIFGAKHTHKIIVQISTPCKRRISLYLDPFGLAVVDQFFRITQWMTFDLIYCRDNAGILCQLFQMPKLLTPIERARPVFWISSSTFHVLR